LADVTSSPRFFLSSPADRAADRVRLPAGGLDHLGDGGTLRPAQHGDQHRLLGPLARAGAARLGSAVCVGQLGHRRSRRLGQLRPPGVGVEPPVEQAWDGD
jgi:hypothetical protein